MGSWHLFVESNGYERGANGVMQSFSSYLTAVLAKQFNEDWIRSSITAETTLSFLPDDFTTVETFLIQAAVNDSLLECPDGNMWSVNVCSLIKQEKWRDLAAWSHLCSKQDQTIWCIFLMSGSRVRGLVLHASHVLLLFLPLLPVSQKLHMRMSWSCGCSVTAVSLIRVADLNPLLHMLAQCLLQVFVFLWGCCSAG